MGLLSLQSLLIYSCCTAGWLLSLNLSHRRILYKDHREPQCWWSLSLTLLPHMSVLANLLFFFWRYRTHLHSSLECWLLTFESLSQGISGKNVSSLKTTHIQWLSLVGYEDWELGINSGALWIVDDQISLVLIRVWFLWVQLKALSLKKSVLGSIFQRHWSVSAIHSTESAGHPTLLISCCLAALVSFSQVSLVDSFNILQILISHPPFPIAFCFLSICISYLVISFPVWLARSYTCQNPTSVYLQSPNPSSHSLPTSVNENASFSSIF